MASVTYGKCNFWALCSDYGQKKFDRIIFLGLNAQTLGGRLAQF